jgi:release factor glutamine methyltransferase
VLLLRPPAVYQPQGDTWLLAEVLRDEIACRPARVLDVCSGTGALACTAASSGAAEVTAVDISRRAVATAWVNARSRGLAVRVRCGDLFAPVAGERFDVVVANPPYVPSSDDRLPTSGRARAWDAGVDGRAVLDRICAGAPDVLAPGGALLMVFSGVCGTDDVLARMTAAGLDAEVLARRFQPFGPVFTARAPMLEARGYIDPGQRFEELVVVRGRVAP